MNPRYPNFFFYALVLHLLVGCGGTVLRPKQFDHAKVTTDYPAVVMVSVPNSHICSGTFIGPRVVLTASHCVPEDVEYIIQSDFGEFKTSNVIRYGSGTERDPNDIALLVLDERVADFSKGQILAVAPFANEGMRLRLVGFGESAYQSGEGTEEKRTGTNTVSRLGDWIEFNTQLQTARKELIAGPENDAAAGAGDSGGPAIFEWGGREYVVGVSHATSVRMGVLVTEYCNLSGGNLAFLRRMAQERELEILFQ